MKTLILTAALVVLTTATFSQEKTTAMSNDFALNSDQISVAIYPNSNDAVTLILSKEDGQKIKLMVTDTNDDVLYSKRYAKVNNAKVTYDVSEFPAGSYTFEVVKGKDVLYAKTFSKKDNSIALAD